MNRVFLVGNLGQDAELKVTEGGAQILKFSLATSETWKDKDGAKKERTEWNRCTLFGKRAESLAPYLTKGSKLVVEGSLRTSSYEKDGVEHKSTEIVVSNVEFAGGARREATTETESDVAAAVASADEIPF